MKDSVNNPRGKNENGKKFLKTQVYTISEKIGKALSKDNDNKEDVESGNKKKPRTEKNIIKDILEEKSDLLGRRAIVGDIISYTTKIGGEERQMIKFKCKYGLSITIDNLNSFLDFCAIHGFIPMVDKIFIEGHDVSQVKKLYNFFAFVISKPGNPLIVNSLANEIKKLENSLQSSAKEVLLYLQQIVVYTMSTYQYLLGDRLQKIKNIGALSENIFAEIAIRLENQIREKIEIESSYLKLAGYKDDIEKKTDMDFIIKKTKSQSYQLIPMQFTTSGTVGEKIKEKSVESYLIRAINEKSKIGSFLILAVNGEFSKHITHGDDEGGEGRQENEEYIALNKEYRDWVNNPQEREKNVGSKFPLFIDSIDPKIIQPAEIMYIALHMLYHKYNFRYTTKKSYLDTSKKIGRIDKTKRLDINGINPSNICVDGCSIENIENPRPGYPGLLKHRFSISYQGEHMGVIVVYEVKQNTKNT